VVYLSPETGDLQEWIATLKAHHVGVVAVGPLLREEEKEEKEIVWLQSQGTVFKRVFGDDLLRGMVLYRVRPQAENG
jgi:hypothetical protein